MAISDDSASSGWRSIETVTLLSFVDLSLKSIPSSYHIILCLSNGRSLLQVRLGVFPSLGHQGSLQGGSLH